MTFSYSASILTGSCGVPLSARGGGAARAGRAAPPVRRPSYDGAAIGTRTLYGYAQVTKRSPLPRISRIYVTLCCARLSLNWRDILGGYEADLINHRSLLRHNPGACISAVAPQYSGVRHNLGGSRCKERN